MEETLPSVIDFLDTPERDRQPGEYIFNEHEEEYLEEIPEEGAFSYTIRRHPSFASPGLVEIYLSYVDLSEVFSTVQASCVTYVNRKTDANITYEATLELFLKDPGGIVVIHGPSKLGKTVLWKSIIYESERIVLSCSEDKEIKNIYQQILFELDQPIPLQKTVEDTDTSGKEKAAEVALGPSAAAQAKLKLQSSKAKTTSQQETFKYEEHQYNVDTVANELLNKNITLIYENYHRLSPETLRKLSIDLRTLSDGRVNTLFVGIPENPFQIIEFNPELKGRVSFMPFSFWHAEDLQRIALGGQEILRAHFTQSSLDFLSGEAAGSPLLMQFYCYIACLASDITHTQDQDIDIDISQERFGFVMKKWGIQRLDACRPICEFFQVEAKKLSFNFHDLLFDKIKKSKPELSLELKEFDFWPEQKAAINDLMLKLNEYDPTRDIFHLDAKLGILNINDPLFISYVRWILL